MSVIKTCNEGGLRIEGFECFFCDRDAGDDAGLFGDQPCGGGNRSIADGRQRGGIVECGVFVECVLDDASDLLTRERQRLAASGLVCEELFEDFVRKIGVGEDFRDVVEFFEFV